MFRSHPILIVEDSDDDYYATTRVLAKFGAFPVSRCIQATEVMQHLRQNKSPDRPSLIFLDLNLSGKGDGRSVLVELKADQQFRSIPVVIMTTSKNPLDISHCFNNGAAGYMVKHVNLDKFVESIEMVLKYWFQVMTLPSKAESAP